LKIKNGSWEYSELFRDLEVMKSWGIHDPRMFWNLPKFFRELLIAETEASGMMQGFEMEVKK
jgi:hypothetical protein